MFPRLLAGSLLLVSNICVIWFAGGAQPFIYVSRDNPPFTGDITVINTANNAVVGSAISVGSPKAIAIHPTGTRVYVANSNSSGAVISVIDTTTNTVIDTVNLASGEIPVGLAVNSIGTRLYVTIKFTSNGGRLKVFDTANYALIANLDLTGINSGTLTLMAPGEIALNPSGTLVYILASATPTSGIIVIDTASNSIRKFSPFVSPYAATSPKSIVVNPAGTRLYVADFGDGSAASWIVAVIDATTNTLLAKITGVGQAPKAVALNPAGTKLYVASFNSVVVVDTSTNGATSVASGTNFAGISQFFGNSSSPLIAASAWLLTGNIAPDSSINFLGTAANKDLVFRTANVEQMRISNVGSVGIGANLPDPAAKLHVIGNLRLDGDLICNTACIHTQAIADNQITTNLIADNAVNSDKILNGSVSGVDLAVEDCGVGNAMRGFGGAGPPLCINNVGTITAVNTGSASGLMGGSSSGAANLTLLTTCGDGQILKWIAAILSWSCANDNNSGGTVLSITAGAGLDGGTITTSGTISVQAGGITNIMLAGSIDLGKLANQSCTTSGQVVYGWNSGTLQCQSVGSITAVLANPGSGLTAIEMPPGSGKIILSLATPTSSSLGGIKSSTCAGTNKVTGINTAGSLTCATDVDTNSGGTVTNISVGGGLTTGLGNPPITTAGTISIESGGVTSDHIADGTIQLADMHDQDCGSGNAIRGWSGATLECVSSGAFLGWSLEGNPTIDPTKNFLGTIDSQPLILKTYNKEALRVDTDGNVGIGTTLLPLHQKLEVAGGILANPGKPSCAPSAAGYSFRGDGCYDTGMFSTGDGELHFYTNQIDTVTLSNGNVGIGIDLPSEKLDVNGNLKLQLRSCSSGSLPSRFCSTSWLTVTPSGSIQAKSSNQFSFPKSVSNSSITLNPEGGGVVIGRDVSPGKAQTYIYNGGTDIGLYLGNGRPFGQSQLEIDGPSVTHIWVAEKKQPIFTVQAGGNVTMQGTLEVYGDHTAAYGNLFVDYNDSNNGSLLEGPSLRIGGAGTGEGIASNRNGSSNQYGLDFYTGCVSLTCTPRLSITNSGQVGIGTQNPKATLHVVGRAFFSDVIEASGGFLGECNDEVLNPPSPVSISVYCNQDVAEAYASVESTKPGDVVTLIPGAIATVRKSAQPYDELLVGVVSANPGLIFDHGQTYLSGDNSHLITKDKTVIALVGRVLVSISVENGPIRAGDPLTSSSKPGIAMKAMKAGKIIGYALENAEHEGKILVLLQPGTYIPQDLQDQLNEDSITKLREMNAGKERRIEQLTQKIKELEGKAGEVDELRQRLEKLQQLVEELTKK